MINIPVTTTSVTHSNAVFVLAVVHPALVGGRVNVAVQGRNRLAALQRAWRGESLFGETVDSPQGKGIDFGVFSEEATVYICGGPLQKNHLREDGTLRNPPMMAHFRVFDTEAGDDLGTCFSPSYRHAVDLLRLSGDGAVRYLPNDPRIEVVRIAETADEYVPFPAFVG